MCTSKKEVEEKKSTKGVRNYIFSGTSGLTTRSTWFDSEKLSSKLPVLFRHIWVVLPNAPIRESDEALVLCLLIVEVLAPRAAVAPGVCAKYSMLSEPLLSRLPSPRDFFLRHTRNAARPRITTAADAPTATPVMTPFRKPDEPLHMAVTAAGEALADVVDVTRTWLPVTVMVRTVAGSSLPADDADEEDGGGGGSDVSAICV